MFYGVGVIDTVAHAYGSALAVLLDTAKKCEALFGGLFLYTSPVPLENKLNMHRTI